MKPPARYALSEKIAGFDFFQWLVMQKAAGAEAVAFDTRHPRTNKFAREEVMRRYESILRPGPALLGMGSEVGPHGIYYAKGGQQELVDHVKAGGTFPRLRSVLPPGVAKYTVTMREFDRYPHRNSKPCWREFASEIGAAVIEDYSVKPIHLHERMALYAGAEMNFFVTNGPVMLCFLSEYPAMGFDVQNSPMIPLGIPMGEPYPYLMKDRHFQIYEPDTLENIRNHFERWRASR